MQKLTIVTDMDDVLEDFCDVWVSYLNGRFGRDVRPEDVTDWDISKSYPGIDKHLLYKVIEREDFWKLISPFSDAVAVTRQLVEEGHRVYVATKATPVTALYKYEHVMKRFFPHIPARNFNVVNDKSLLRGDVMIDDNPRNLGGDFKTKILFTAPHNLSCPAAANGFLRADNWQTVYKIISEVSGQW